MTFLRADERCGKGYLVADYDNVVTLSGTSGTVQTLIEIDNRFARAMHHTAGLEVDVTANGDGAAIVIYLKGSFDKVNWIALYVVEHAALASGAGSVLVTSTTSTETTAVSSCVGDDGAFSAGALYPYLKWEVGEIGQDNAAGTIGVAVMGR